VCRSILPFFSIRSARSSIGFPKSVTNQLSPLSSFPRNLLQTCHYGNGRWSFKNYWSTKALLSKKQRRKSHFAGAQPSYYASEVCFGKQEASGSLVATFFTKIIQLRNSMRFQSFCHDWRSTSEIRKMLISEKSTSGSQKWAVKIFNQKKTEKKCKKSWNNPMGVSAFLGYDLNE